MTSSNPDLGDRLLTAVVQLNRWATRHADMPIPLAQGRLLGLINAIGPARIGELADADRCSQPTMTAQVQRMESVGWVLREHDPRDARACVISLTDSGREMLQRVRAGRREVLGTVFTTLTPEEMAAVERATETIEMLVEHSHTTN